MAKETFIVDCPYCKAKVAAEEKGRAERTFMDENAGEPEKDIKDGKNKKHLMLAEGIKQLRERNLIDDRLFDWSQQLHAFRNLAAHPEGDGGSISKQDVEDLQAFVYAIVEYIYDLADRYQEFKERQAKRALAKEKAKNAPPDPFGLDD